MNEINGIPSTGDSNNIEQFSFLKGIGRENIQPVPFGLREDNEIAIESLLERECDSGDSHIHQHCHRDDLMQELLNAIQEIDGNDLSYLETLQESSDDIFSRTVSYFCIPIAFVDLAKSVKNSNSIRRLARAAKAYRNYVIAITKDLETQIDEKLLVRAFQSESSNLAAPNDDWLTNALILELRRAKNASGLDLGHFVNFILFDSSKGFTLKSQVIEGVANRSIKTRLATRIGANRTKVKLSATESFVSLQATRRLNLFDNLIASDLFLDSSILGELLDYLVHAPEPNSINKISLAS